MPRRSILGPPSPDLKCVELILSSQEIKHIQETLIGIEANLNGALEGEASVVCEAARVRSAVDCWNVGNQASLQACPLPRMQRQRPITRRTFRPTAILGRRGFAATTHHGIKKVQNLLSWEIAAFKELAFRPAIPARLPFSPDTIPLACQRWFSHDNSPEIQFDGVRENSELNYMFWQQYQDITVPIELTQIPLGGEKTFHRSNAPLKIFLAHSIPLQPAIKAQSAATARSLLYIAQCPLNDLPVSLQEDLPTPELVLKAGKGDIYDSSLWMGRPPTFTPLHKDPNPNLFVQLAGRKVVRLFNPEVGSAIYDFVQMKLRVQGNANFRGEEMMQGREREELEEAVWGDGADEISMKQGFEVRLGMGNALFIPKGWWHSIRGIGDGMNASVNWWFR